MSKFTDTYLINYDNGKVLVFPTKNLDLEISTVSMANELKELIRMESDEGLAYAVQQALIYCPKVKLVNQMSYIKLWNESANGRGLCRCYNSYITKHPSLDLPILASYK